MHPLSSSTFSYWKGFLQHFLGKEDYDCESNKNLSLTPFLQISYEDLPHLGPDHQKIFSCRVTVGERSFKEGSGATKVAAKKNAALYALEGLFNMPVELGE